MFCSQLIISLCFLLPLALSCKLLFQESQHANRFPLKPSNESFLITVGSPTSLQAFNPIEKNSTQIRICTSGPCSQICEMCLGRATIRPSKNLATAIAVLKRLCVKRFVLIFDETVSKPNWNLPEILMNMEAHGSLTMVSFSVDFGKNASSTLLRKSLESLMEEKRFRHRYFMIIAKECNTQKIFSIAQTIGPANGLLNQRFFWTVVSGITNTKELLNQLPSYANVLLLQNSRDCNLTDLKTLATEAFGQCATCDLSCKDIIIDKLDRARTETVDLWSTSTQSTETKWKKIGIFNTTCKSFRMNDRIFPNTFVDFGGRVRVVGTSKYTGFVMDKPNGTTFTFKNHTCYPLEGSLIEMTELLAEQLKFRPCYIFSPDGSAGNYDVKTGKGTGLIGLATRREATMISYSLTPSVSRGHGVDFIFPFKNEPLAVVIRRQTKPRFLFYILSPLSFGSWIGVAGAAVGIAALLSLIARLSPVSGYNLRLKTAILDEIRFKDNMLTTVGLLLEQGQIFYPFARSSRAVMIGFWIFVLIIINTYNANLVTFLTVPDKDLPIKSIEDLSRQSRILPIARNGSFVVNFLQTSTDPVLRKVGTMLKAPMPKTHKRGMELVRNAPTANIAYISDISKAYVEESRDCKQFAVLPETFNDAGLMAFVMPKNAFYGDRMDAYMQQMVESGFVRRAIDFWFDRAVGPRCSKIISSEAASFKEIDVDLLIGTFFLFSVCIALGMLCFAVEWLAFIKCKEKRTS